MEAGPKSLARTCRICADKAKATRPPSADPTWHPQLAVSLPFHTPPNITQSLECSSPPRLPFDEIEPLPPLSLIYTPFHALKRTRAQASTFVVL